MTMKPLIETFTRKGLTYRQIRREDDVAVFEVTSTDWKHPMFEVIHVRKRSDRKIEGRLVEAHEAFPSDEEWGRYGYTALNLDHANHVFERVLRLTRARIERETGRVISRV